jgi:hypothetical protein
MVPFTVTLKRKSIQIRLWIDSVSDGVGSHCDNDEWTVCIIISFFYEKQLKSIENSQFNNTCLKNKTFFGCFLIDSVLYS